MMLIFWFVMAIVGLALLPPAIENAALVLHLIVVAITRVIVYVAIAGLVALAFVAIGRV